ncbi:ABC transporter transmembrane domain-containing protein [Shewanella colwelliana]|uniref:ABC transporter transmembrane domain-containing protein n=1 Tax=Shewanella colwelliana TaxID=23 RepID=UPI00299D15DA|nr:ABC transporter transmembrane domain-containing protein [Shewanella colwelliana]MDX1282270.1 ABC transporter transmembrane domain-containing protein [Shewanella colwelliana]
MVSSFRLLMQNRAFTELLLSSTFINLLSLALPFTMLQIYDRILPNEGYGTASILAATVAIAILLELLLRYARSWLLASSSANFELQTTTQLVKSLLNADYRHLAALGPGKIANGLNSITTVRELYSGQAAVAMMDFPFVILFLALLTYIGGPLVFIPIAVWGAVGIFVYLIGQKLTAVAQQLTLTDSEYSRMLIRVLSGLTTTKALALETQLSSSYAAINYQRLALQQQVDWLSSKLQELIQGASQITTLLIVFIGCFEVLNGSLTTGGLAACSILAGRAIAPLSAIISLRSRLASAKTAMTQINNINKLPAEQFQGSQVYQQKLPLGPIEFNKVEAVQPGAILHTLSATIAPGSLTCIHSNPLTHSSLFLSLLGGFHQPSEGRITIAGEPISAHDANEYTQSVAYVPPWPSLFSGTIIENMTMFRPEREMAAMEVAEQLGLTNTIAQLPAGYQTQLANNESQMLNKGAIKLIAMVRAMVQSPSILLLDEPMVSLDIDGQTRLLSLIKNQQSQMTIIAATYFTSMQQCADQIIDLTPKAPAASKTNRGEEEL